MPEDYLQRTGGIMIITLWYTKPTNMTAFELQEGKTHARQRFYGVGSVLKRLTGNLYNPVIYLATNYANIKQTKIEKKRNIRLKMELLPISIDL